MKSGDSRRLQPLLKKGIVEHMGRIIKAELDVRIQEIVLERVKDLLSFGFLNNSGGCSPDTVKQIFEQNDVMKVIEELKCSENSQVAELARKIVL